MVNQRIPVARIPQDARVYRRYFERASETFKRQKGRCQNHA